MHALYGVMLALVGRTAEGVREAEQAVALAASQPKDQNSLYSRFQLVRVYIVAGQKEKAIDGLGSLALEQNSVTAGRLRLDPTFASLKGNPRFEKLLAQPVGTAKP